ncbi:MAG: outer membrane protein transport protein [Acidobacteriota bacterium]
MNTRTRLMAGGQKTGTRWMLCCLCLIVALAPTAPAEAAGFGIFEQGSKAMGMAGAFTAQADDPSLMYHNLGGLAFVEERQISVGATWIHVDGTTFQGANPFPGADDRAEMVDLDVFPPHVYYLRPLNERWKLGVGVNSPFGLATEWQDKDNFSGRFLSNRAELTGVDLNLALGYRVNESFGFGFGVVGRISKVEQDRRIPFINPFTGGVTDIGQLALESDFDTGFGFNVGFLHRVGRAFSWGASYRSKVEVDYSGDGRLTQNLSGIPSFDAVIAGTLPFDQDLPIESNIEFPDQWSVGVALLLTDNLLAEVDVNWTGWSSFDELPIDFVNDDLPDSTIEEEYEDVYNYRLGFQYTTASGSQWRVGFGIDETPVPTASVSPLLPDNDRDVYTIGYGTSSGGMDIAFMWLDVPEVTTLDNREGFFGTYDTDAYLVGVTFNF